MNASTGPGRLLGGHGLPRRDHTKVSAGRSPARAPASDPRSPRAAEVDGISRAKPLASQDRCVQSSALPGCCSARVGAARHTHARDHVFLWTSNRQQRSITRSMAPSTAMGAGAAGASCSRLCSACSTATIAGSRKLPRQFWLGFALPNIVDVSGRRRAGMVADFHGAGWAAGPSPFWRGTRVPTAGKAPKASSLAAP
jgi:hypothetical protein